ncbi:MAG: hypothetical protein FVQ79_00580 [Planctomycetes bacterium]|nr:hypothetical protein [Planctomycetota bacterium]
MSDQNKYESRQVQEALQVLIHLGGHEVNGLKPSEIGKSLNLAAHRMTRILANLRLAGVAEEIPESSRWRLSPRIPQIATAMLTELDKGQRKLDETKERFTKHPH